MTKRRIVLTLTIIIIIISMTSCKQSSKIDNANSYTKSSEVIQSNSTSVNTSSKQVTQIKPTEPEKSSNNSQINNITDLYKNLDTSKSQFKKGYYDYKGSINQNLLIQMSLYQLDKDILGTYFYEKERKELKLKGKTDGKNIILYEYDDTDKNTGIFQGTMTTVDKIEGSWFSPDGKTQYPFSLSLISNLPGVEYGKRYGIAIPSKSDAEIEKFVTEVQGYMADNDKEKLAQVINYPIKVKIKGQSVSITNKDELIKNYDDIFTPEYKDSIIKAYPKNLFGNYQGVMVMLPGGLFNLWINVDSNSNLKIIAINN